MNKYLLYIDIESEMLSVGQCYHRLFAGELICEAGSYEKVSGIIGQLQQLAEGEGNNRDELKEVCHTVYLYIDEDSPCGYEEEDLAIFNRWRAAKRFFDKCVKVQK